MTNKPTKRKVLKQRRSNWRGLRRLAPVVSAVHGKLANFLYVDETGKKTTLGPDKVIVSLKSEEKLEFVLRNEAKIVSIEPNDVRSVKRLKSNSFVIKLYSNEKIFLNIAEEENKEEAEAIKQEE